MSTTPTAAGNKQNWRVPLPEETPHLIVRAFEKLQSDRDDHDQAIVALDTKVRALQAAAPGAAGAASTTSLAGAAGSSSTTSLASAALSSRIPFLYTVNDQTGQTAYTTQTTDNKLLVIFDDASPVALTLNSVVTAPWMTFVLNLGAGLVTATPSSGTINGNANQEFVSAGMIFYDGTNFWALVIPPVGTSGTIALAALTALGTTGSITVVDGIITAFVNPT
jgi:hypothetical protein